MVQICQAEDLFYRLAVLVLKVPPLRVRQGDLGPLVDGLLDRINHQSADEPGFSPKTISPGAKTLLGQQPWPGNVRELENTLRRAAVWSDRREISEQDIRDALLPVTGSSRSDAVLNRSLEHGIDLPELLGEVEKMLLDAGIGGADDIERAKETSNGFGRFVRSLVGLDRKAVTDAFGDFVSNGNASAAQLEFVGMVIEHLPDQGTMDPGLLYEPPFIDVAPTGPEQVFDEASVARLVTVIRQLSDSAAA